MIPIGLRAASITRHRSSAPPTGPTVGSSGWASVHASTAQITGLSISSGSAILLYVQIFVNAGGAPPTTVTDSASNTYVLISGPDLQSTNQSTYWYLCLSSSGSVSSITVDLGTTEYYMIEAVEIKGALSARPWDDFNFTEFSGTTAWAGTSLTTAYDNELLIMAGGTEQDGNTWSSPGAGWIQIINGDDTVIGQAETAYYNAAATAGSYNWSATSANAYYGSLYQIGFTDTTPTAGSAPTFLASIAAVSSGAVSPPNNNSTTGASGGATSINTTGASILIAVLLIRNTENNTISDSQSNTWTYSTIYSYASGTSTYMAVAYVINPSTSATHTFNMSSVEGTCFVYAFSGGSNWKLDYTVANLTLQSGTTVDILPIIPNAAECIVVTGIGSNGSIAASGTLNNGFTGGQGVSAGQMLPQDLNSTPEVGGAGYLITSSIGIISGTTFSSVTSNTDWNGIIAVFSQTPN
jgi:hypothetical protein